ncbi:MAG: 50S ribosomal protein L11 methyltransferase [Candidatus Heteroscillospira sp.]|jgi:ribosomal protein L11 methyltransferase
MRWIEASVETKSELIDLKCAELAELGVPGMVIEDEQDFRDFLENNRQYWDYVDEELEQRFAGVSRIKFYLSDDEEGLAVLARVRDNGYNPTVSYIEDSDWENNWREFYRPLEIGEKLVVVPEWEDCDCNGRLPLRLDPGLIFGTGSHATTRMCLMALENYAAPGKRVLDLGCGSGILGIGARVLGCGWVCGCDIDPKAPDVALSNAGLNGIDGSDFRIYAGDVLTDGGLKRELGGGYDIVLANIVSDVIIPLAPMVPGFLKEDGIFITSGIIEGRQDEVRAAIEAAGFRVLSHDCQEEWHCFVCAPAG